MPRSIAAAFASAPKRGLIFLVSIYQCTLSRVLPGRCRFSPSCSEYAKQALSQHGSVLGLAYTVKRLLKCQPCHQGGYDPVPQKKK